MKTVRTALAGLSLATALIAPLAQAAVISDTTDVNFAGTSTTFGFGGQNFVLSDNGSGFPSPVSVRTVGAAAVSSTTIFGLMPSAYFDPARSTLIFDGDPFLQYASYATAASISFSGPPTFIGLRVQLSDGFHYGYAQFEGTLLKSYGFESVAGVGIEAGALAVAAIPVPGALVMMVGGLGVLGVAVGKRRKEKQAV